LSGLLTIPDAGHSFMWNNLQPSAPYGTARNGTFPPSVSAMRNGRSC